MEKDKTKYKKDAHGHTDNTDYINKEEYKETKITERLFNDKTEAFEYKERIINHKLDWENQLLALDQSFEETEED